MAERTIRNKIISLIFLFGLVVVLNRFFASDSYSAVDDQPSRPPLQQMFEQLPGWPASSFIALSDDIVSSLMLDDYLYRNFGIQDQGIALYIGFYRKATKVGAAHDPLVCFQGQGWQIAARGKGFHETPGGAGIHYAEMLANRQNHREFLIYWFQTADKTADNTFKQKMDMIVQRLTGGRENNAFVRISVPLHGKMSTEDARKRILDFMNEFYPRFLSYLMAERKPS